MEPLHINLKDSELYFYPDFFGRKESDILFQSLLNNTPWQEGHIKIFGKKVTIPRLQYYCGQADKNYTYSNTTLLAQPFTDEIKSIKAKVEEVSHVAFTNCLANLYRHGNDSNGWHSDDEPELGKNPIIGSVSFGNARRFMLKHKRDKNLRSEILLTHGSLLLMRGETQHHWLHQIPKEKTALRERVNLTFRILY